MGRRGAVPPWLLAVCWLVGALSGLALAAGQPGDEAEAEAEARADAAATAAGRSGLPSREAGAEGEALPGEDGEVGKRLCPDVDDHHGRWEGSTEVGKTYKLTCSPGYEVIGTRGNGTRGKRSAAMVCPESMEWPEDLWCEDTDDCASLKHGCGAMGVCMDLVAGYDCNCERGYPRHRYDGEIICGTDTQRDICGGHTCGSYGICVDLRGNISEFESWPNKTVREMERKKKPNGTLAYRCECVDGWYDNGQTCVPHDCGALVDEVGAWFGNTHTGAQYTLKCFPGASVWGGALNQITITCGNEGKWLSHPVCVNPVQQALDERLERAKFWFNVGMVVVCVCCAAMAAGLTLGLVSLDPFGLQVLLSTRPSDYPKGEERKRLKRNQRSARRMMPLVKDHHMLLVTLLLFNTVANEALPLFLDQLVSPVVAVFLSVSVVLICGEILPAAIFTGTWQFSIAAACVPFVGALQCVLFPVAHPVARLLDHLLDADDEDDVKYSRAELKSLLQQAGRARERRHNDAEHEFSSEMDEVTSSDALNEASVPLRAGANQTYTATAQTGHLPFVLKREGRFGSEGAQSMAPTSSLRSRLADARSRGNISFAEDAEVVDIEQPAPEVASIEPPEPSGEEEDEPKSVLRTQEVEFLNGAFALRSHKLHDEARREHPFYYWSVEKCLVAHCSKRAIELIPAVRQGHRAIVLVSDETHDRKTATLRVRDVNGCVLIRDLFRGGRRPLSESRCCSRVVISKEATLLEALQSLADARAAAGLVIDCLGGITGAEPEGELEGHEVLGVVTTSRLLAKVTDGDSEDEGWVTKTSSYISRQGSVQQLDEDCSESEVVRKNPRMRAGSKFLLKNQAKKETKVTPPVPVNVQPVSKRIRSASAINGPLFRSVSAQDADLTTGVFRTSQTNPELRRTSWARTSSMS